jgi:hypothetical protein
LLPYLPKRKRDFVSKRKLPPKGSHCLKKNCVPKWLLNLLHKNSVHENVFNWYLNLFSKSLGFKNKMNSKENFELRL